MAIRSRSSKVYLERCGLRPVPRGAWRAHAYGAASPLLKLLPVEDASIDPRFLQQAQGDRVDRGAAKPWPYGH